MREKVLLTLMNEHGMSVTETARACHVNEGTIRNIMKSGRCTPKIYERIADYFGEDFYVTVSNYGHKAYFEARPYPCLICRDLIEPNECGYVYCEKCRAKGRAEDRRKLKEAPVEAYIDLADAIISRAFNDYRLAVNKGLRLDAEIVRDEMLGDEFQKYLYGGCDIKGLMRHVGIPNDWRLP